MKILTYQATSEDPGAFEFIALILTEQPGKPGKPFKMDFHPVTPFRGESPNEAAAKAQSWWDAELKAAQDKLESRAAISERMKRAAAAKRSA